MRTEAAIRIAVSRPAGHPVAEIGRSRGEITVKKMSLAAAVAAGAMALTGCGGGTKTADPSTSTAAGASTSASTASGSGSASAATSSESEAPASTTTTDAGTGDTASSLANAKVGDKISGKTLADAMSAAFKDGTSGHMSMDMGGSITAEGDFQVADGKQNSTMTMEVAGSKMEMISVGGKTYMKSPMFAGGTKWVSMDSATAGDAGAPDVNTFDPETMAKALGDKDITVTAKDGGNTTVKMDLNMANLIEAMGDAGDSLGSATASMPKSIPVTYTLDSEGRPVETVMNMGMEIKVTYSDWGKKVSIEAPPASEVTTM